MGLDVYEIARMFKTVRILRLVRGAASAEIHIKRGNHSTKQHLGVQSLLHADVDDGRRMHVSQHGTTSSFRGLPSGLTLRTIRLEIKL